jgi:pentatricopeptide repeat protein
MMMMMMTMTMAMAMRMLMIVMPLIVYGDNDATYHDGDGGCDAADSSDGDAADNDDDGDGDGDGVLQVFRLLKEQEWYEPDVGTHIKIIGVLGRCKQAAAAFAVFESMREEEKCRPTVEAYTALLAACTRSGLVDKAMAVGQQLSPVSLPTVAKNAWYR